MADSTKTVAFLVAPEGIEQQELTSPWEDVRKAALTPVLVSTQAGSVQAFNHLDKADTFPVDKTADEVSVDDFAALVLPGGVANPDALRTDSTAVELVKAFVRSGKPVAAICHAPWVLIEADVLAGKRVTSWPSLRTDLTNAGAEWVDQEVVTTGNLITSRNPDDLPAFGAAIVAAVQGGPR